MPAGDQILDELKKAGLLDEAAAARVKRESLLSGRPAEELLYSKRLADDAKIAELKSKVLGVPYYKIDFQNFNNKLLALIPEKTVRTYGVVPISQEGNMLVVGMVRPDDEKAKDALKFIARGGRLNLGAYVISYGDWQEALRRYSPYRNEVEQAVESLNLKPGGARERVVELEAASQEHAEEAPIIRIVSETFREAVAQQASDIHIEPQENYVRVRFRVNGKLHEEAALPLELAQPVVSRVKIISNLKIDETRIPQDGRFRTKIFDREIDFRVSTFPTPAGEKAAIRVLDPTVGLKGFKDLGLAGGNLPLVEEGLEKPYGMILVSGPTGSGKTTTLYALLQQLNKEDVNIVSLEDPVEYLVSGINQSQVRPEIGYDFASGLRQILRQDPDVIMVGEIRDGETASLAVQAALTGHVVLSTLHTNNAAGVIPRLIDMKVEPFLLPVSLNLMMSQRLVGVLCSSCKKAEEAPPAVQKVIADALKNIPAEAAKGFAPPYKIYHAPGCDVCKGRGVVGRVAVYEVFRMTPELEAAIAEGPTLQKILKEARAQGMTTLREDGVLKALQGTVSIEEVIRETEEM